MVRQPRSLPTSAGVYIFRRSTTPLYIGKAANLKARVASYFTKAEGRTIKVERMLEEATRLETIETPSEVEALLKEAELIKKYRPKYNVLMRDDKSYFYVGITGEQFPRIFIGHQPRAATNSESVANKRIRTFGKDSPFVDERRQFPARTPKFIGPFTSGTALKTVLKLLRRIFPYCTCRRPHRRPCLNSQMGRCAGYCCTIRQTLKAKSQKLRTGYRKNIRNIIAVLEGRRPRLIARLRREMQEAARRERYEEAVRLRDQLFGLEDVFRHAPLIREPTAGAAWPLLEPKLRALVGAKSPIRRMEGYDISNISGREATGSLVVFRDGRPNKSQYRKFRIKTVDRANDVAMLAEVIRRRLGHGEWPYPELMVVDGGKPQLNAALSVLRESGIQNLESRRPIVSALAKREEVLYAAGKTIPLKRQEPALLHLFQRIRDESHRFARAYHHLLRGRRFRDEKILS